MLYKKLVSRSTDISTAVHCSPILYQFLATRINGVLAIYTGSHCIGRLGYGSLVLVPLYWFYCISRLGTGSLV